MGKFLSTAILAAVAFTFFNCNDDKKKTENIAKSVAKEYTVSASGTTLQKLQLLEVNPTAVKFALDSVQLDSTTSISIKEINPVKLTKQKDTVVLAADMTVLATVYTVESTKPATPDKSKPATPAKPSTKATKAENKSVRVTVKGTIVNKKLELEVTFPAVLTKSTTLKISGMSK
jgi:hypothetical protein